MRALGESLGVDVAVPREVHDSNNRYVNTLVQWILSRVIGRAIGVVGLTYKIGSDVIEESAGWKAVQMLLNHYVEVFAYDPLFTGPLPRGGRRMNSLRDCIEKSDLVLVMLPYPEAIALDAATWARTPEQRRGQSGADRIVVDCWRVLPHLVGITGVDYAPTGIGRETI